MASLPVYTGRWYNYSEGQAAITVTVQDGALILAAIATFIGIVGGQAWLIVAYAVHQCRAVERPQDGLYHQQQAILRNSATPLGALWHSLRAFWSWKGYTERRARRTAVVLLPALLTFTIFTVFAILSSRTASRAYDASTVKIQPQSCGFVYFPFTEEGTLLQMQNQLLEAKQALTYVNTCYNSSLVTGVSCNVLPRRSLPYTWNYTQDCPFGNRCIGQPVLYKYVPRPLQYNFNFKKLYCDISRVQGSAVDTTSWLDTNDDFGINAPPEDRVQMRKETLCAVVNVSDVTSHMNASNGLPTNQYYLGEVQDSDGSVFTQYTASVTDLSSVEYITYTIQTYSSDQDIPKANMSWIPIPDFNSTYGDISLFVIAFGGTYYAQPVNDPLFAATKAAKVPFGPYELELYAPNQMAGLIACVDALQIQSADGKIQTSLDGMMRVIGDTETAGFSATQQAAAKRLTIPAVDAKMYDSVWGLGVAALQAQESIFGSTISVGLPDDQWRIETQGWFETNLAMIQNRVVSYVSKAWSQENNVIYADLTTNFAGSTNITEELNAMCQQQKIRSIAGYQNFSVAGIAVTIAIGTLIILVSLFFDTLVGFIQDKYGNDSQKYKKVKWRTDSLLQLQRLAYQYAGQGHWERGNKSVPVTRFKFLELPNLRGKMPGYEDHEGSQVTHYPKGSKYSQSQSSESVRGSTRSVARGDEVHPQQVPAVVEHGEDLGVRNNLNGAEVGALHEGQSLLGQANDGQATEPNSRYADETTSPYTDVDRGEDAPNATRFSYENGTTEHEYELRRVVSPISPPQRLHLQWDENDNYEHVFDEFRTHEKRYDDTDENQPGRAL